jgi:hypothetical protein
VRAGDFNGDGHLDLAVANSGAGGFSYDTVTILLGNGDGTFKTGASYVVGSHPFSVVVADLNGDGIPDIATANEVSNTVGVLLGMGDGTFRPAVQYPDSSDPIWIEAGDFNHDGSLDLVTANDQGNALHVFLGNGDGTFSPFKSFAAGTRPDSVAVGDWNGDGFLDLAATNEFSNKLWVLMNAAEGPLVDGPGSEPDMVSLASNGPTSETQQAVLGLPMPGPYWSQARIPSPGADTNQFLVAAVGDDLVPPIFPVRVAERNSDMPGLDLAWTQQSGADAFSPRFW